jgi:hypothetical protein
MFKTTIETCGDAVVVVLIVATFGNSASLVSLPAMMIGETFAAALDLLITHNAICHSSTPS